MEVAVEENRTQINISQLFAQIFLFYFFGHMDFEFHEKWKSKIFKVMNSQKF
jgi:hypothetical protein